MKTKDLPGPRAKWRVEFSKKLLGGVSVVAYGPSGEALVVSGFDLIEFEDGNYVIDKVAMKLVPKFGPAPPTQGPTPPSPFDKAVRVIIEYASGRREVVE